MTWVSSTNSVGRLCNRSRNESLVWTFRAVERVVNFGRWNWIYSFVFLISLIGFHSICVTLLTWIAYSLTQNLAKGEKLVMKIYSDYVHWCWYFWHSYRHKCRQQRYIGMDCSLCSVSCIEIVCLGLRVLFCGKRYLLFHNLCRRCAPVRRISHVLIPFPHKDGGFIPDRLCFSVELRHLLLAQRNGVARMTRSASRCCCWVYFDWI